MSVRLFYDPYRVEQLRQRGIAPGNRGALSGGAPRQEARTSLELVEENARLRADNRRLTEEVAQLEAEVARLRRAVSQQQPAPPRRSALPDDDAAARFALLEFDDP